MASCSINQSPASLVVIALLLFAAANPLCHAQLGLGGLTPVVPGVLNSVTPAVSGFLNGATGSLLPGLVNSVTPVVPGVLNSASSPIVPGVLNSVTPIVPGVLNTVTPAVPAVLNGLTPVVPGVLNSVTPAVPAVLNGVANNLLSGLNVSGLLCCTANGNCPSAGATGIAGVPVKLICSNILGAAVTVGQGSTGANGSFIISVSNLVSLLGGLLSPNSPIPCNVVVELPLNQAVCPILSAVTGVLSSALSTVNSVTSGVGGLVGSVTTITFSVIVTLQA